MKKNIITSAATIITSAMLAITAMPIASFAAGNITLEQAKQIALTNAGLNANQVTFVKEGMEMDDGRTKYEVEFYAGNMEYDYDIDALTGAIISFDQDCEVNYMATAPAAVPDARNRGGILCLFRVSCSGSRSAAPLSFSF